MQFVNENKSIRIGIGILLLLDCFTFILFAETKGRMDFLGSWFPVIRTIGYEANIIVWLILALAFGLTGLFVVSRITLSPRQWIQIGFVTLLYIGSAFPLGNLFKEGSLFYKNWMWYFAIWMLHLCLVSLLSIEVLTYRGAFLARWKRGTRAVDEFLRSPSIKKGDYYFFTGLLTWTWISTLLVCFVVLNGIPHVQDGIAQLFQAKVFALGKMAIPLPKQWDFFERVYLIPDHGRFYSIFPPGHALVMALGVWLGMTQYVVPFLSCIIVLLVFLLARMLFTLYVARVSVLFLVLSPFFIFMGGGFMNHPTCLLFLLLGLILWLVVIQKQTEQYSSLYAIGAGFCFGMAFLTRPQTAIAFLPIFVIWIFKEWGKRNAKRILIYALLFAAGSTPPALFLLAFNHATTGSAFEMGYQKNFRGNPLGLGDQNWEGRRTGVDQDRQVHHTPLRGFSNFLCNINGMNFFLFGWPIPSLFFAFVLFLPGLKRGFVERLFIGLILLVGGVYFFFFYQDFCFGPRFFYETMPFWIMLSARGLEEGLSWIQRSWPYWFDSVRTWVYGLIIFFFLFAFATVWVERVVVMSDSYWGTSSTVLEWARERIPEKNALIFVQTEEDQMGLYSVLDPRFDRGWIIAKHYGLEADKKLMQQYPHWPAYLIRYNNPVPPSPAGNILEKIPPLPQDSQQ